MNLLKSEIRRLVRPLRQRISPDYRQQASADAATHFIQSSYFSDYQHFACYQALAEELDTQPLIQALWQAGKTCYLPVISGGPEKILQFALYEKGMKLALNRHQVLEPEGASQLVSGAELEVVLLPLLAFDQLGNRLGTGGGYYDRTFAFIREPGAKPRKTPRLLGFAYALQQVETIPQEAFDVALEAIVREDGIMLSQKRNEDS